MQTSTCPVQGKVKFKRKQNARVAADAHMDRDRVSVYRCYNCRYWHVGHWEFVKLARLIKQARMERDWTW